MSEADVSDETLMAFTDGELDAGPAARIETLMATDPAIRARVEAFKSSRDAVKQLFEPMSETAVPAALLARVQAQVTAAKSDSASAEGEVIAFRRPLRHRPSGVRAWAMPLAACLALLVAGGGGFLTGSKLGSPGASEPLLLAAGDDLRELLDSLPTGGRGPLTESGHQVHIVGSFANAAGQFCREFGLTKTLDYLVGVACAEGERWETQFAMRTQSRTDNFRPASGASALDAFLDSIGAGPYLGANEEASMLQGASR